MKSIAITSLLLTIANTAYGDCSGATNTTCLHVTLWDMFGDGWDSALYYLERPSGAMIDDAPTCDINPVELDVCPDDDGLYYMVVQSSEEDTVPRHSWEVFWTVTLENCTGADTVYTGGFNTTMAWHYEGDTDTWTLVYWQNLWPNTKDCDACGDAAKCKPKPKPKKKPGNKKKKQEEKHSHHKHTHNNDKEKKKDNDHKHKHSHGHGHGSGSSDANTTSLDYTGHYLINPNHRMLDAPRYGPPAVDVQVNMWSQEGNGWWLDDYHGTSWYISDDTRTELFYTGTLCDGFEGSCKICLGDGSYVFRVTGFDVDNVTTWEFCGVRGDYQDELSFHVKKGKCIPDVLVDVTNICNNTVLTEVTMLGMLAVSGVSTEMFNAAESKILSTVLAAEIDGWQASDVNVISSALDVRVLSAKQRALSTFTHDFTFEVTFSPETSFNVDGKSDYALNYLLENIQYTLENHISQGEFLSTLSSAATTLNVVEMQEVSGVELLSIEISSVTYSGAKEMIAGTIVVEEAEYASDNHSSSHSVSTSIVVFLSALGVALVAFVGVVAHRATGYKKISDNSTHVPEVMPSALDVSISHPMSRQADIQSVNAKL